MKRILIVDDEPHVRRVLQLSLERAGYDVKIEHDGQAGLEHVLADPPDALITDINMPRMTGREMLKALHAARPAREFPVFVMTSLTEREERVWVREIPNVDFLEKPLSPRELVARLARHFEGSERAGAAVHA
jgi:DNA-binding response OmpR family regulator